jgi:hypothetical protein
MYKTRILLFVSLAFLLPVIDSNYALKAQKFEKGTIAINAGVGILSSVHYYVGYLAGGKRSPVMSLSGEYGFMKLGPGVMGLGFAFGYQSASYTDNLGGYYYTDKWTTTMFGARATYHPDFLNSEKYDVYGIAQLSFDHFGYRFSTNDPDYGLYYGSSLYHSNSLNSYIRPYLMVGARYYFTKNFGVFSEIGYDLSYVKAGITLNFGPKS